MKTTHHGYEIKTRRATKLTEFATAKEAVEFFDGLGNQYFRDGTSPTLFESQNEMDSWGTLAEVELPEDESEDDERQSFVRAIRSGSKGIAWGTCNGFYNIYRVIEAGEDAAAAFEEECVSFLESYHGDDHFSFEA